MKVHVHELGWSTWKSITENFNIILCVFIYNHNDSDDNNNYDDDDDDDDDDNDDCGDN